MKNIYEYKKVWKFYFILVMLLMPLVMATIKWAGFDRMDTGVFVLFHLVSPYVIITLLIREVALQEVDKKDIINANEIKIRKAVNYLGIGFFIFSHMMNSIFIVTGEQETFSLVMLLLMWGLLLDAGVVITKDKIYYGNRIIVIKEIVRVEKRTENNIRIYLDNGKDVTIRYKKVASYIEGFESKAIRKKI